MDISIRWVPLLIKLALSAAATVLYYKYGSQPDAIKMASIAATVANIAGVLLGFLLTAMTLITAVMDRGLVSRMRETGHYQRLIHETYHSCAALLFVVVAGVVCLFVGEASLKYVFLLLVFLSIFSTLLVIEAGGRFKNIFSVMS